MNRNSFERALAATARVACCSALIGATACKPKPTAPASSAEIPAQPAEPPSTNQPEETSTTPSSPELSSVEPEISQLRVPNPAPFPADFEDCASELRTAIEGWKEAQEREVSKEVKDCCDRYTAHLDDIGSMEGEFRYECCDVQNWRDTRACTPWGPPVPPRMA